MSKATDIFAVAKASMKNGSEIQSNLDACVLLCQHVSIFKLVERQNPSRGTNSRDVC